MVMEINYNKDLLRTADIGTFNNAAIREVRRNYENLKLVHPSTYCIPTKSSIVALVGTMDSEPTQIISARQGMSISFVTKEEEFNEVKYLGKALSSISGFKKKFGTCLGKNSDLEDELM